MRPRHGWLGIPVSVIILERSDTLLGTGYFSYIGIVTVVTLFGSALKFYPLLVES